MNKIIAIGILVSLGIAVIVAVVVEPNDAVMADSLYGLAGLGMFLFGIWGSVLLLKK